MFSKNPGVTLQAQAKVRKKGLHLPCEIMRRRLHNMAEHSKEIFIIWKACENMTYLGAWEYRSRLEQPIWISTKKSWMC